MPSRMIQNNFGGGEISPVLYGRSDLQAYYRGCASAENFFVSKEGTLRKRRGIGTCAAVAHDWSDCRVFPYRYDRTAGGVLVLSFEADEDDGTTTATAELYDKSMEEPVATASFPAEGGVKDVQCKQIGDQLWLSNGSFFKVLTVTYTASTEADDSWDLTASDWSQTPRPSPVKSISASKSSGMDKSNRLLSYRAFVVANGVMSAGKTASVYVNNTWPSGAYVTVTVRVEQGTDGGYGFDYVVLAKKTGGNYGEVARWYPEDFSDSGTKSFTDENISGGDAVYEQTNVLGNGFSGPLCVDCFQQRKVFANAFDRKTGRRTFKATSSVRTFSLGDDFAGVVSVTKNGNDTDQYTVADDVEAPGKAITFSENGTYVVTFLTASSNAYPMTMWFSEVGNIDNFYAGRPTVDSDAFSPTISSTGPAFIRWTCCFQDAMVVFTDCGLFSVGFSQTSGFSASSCRISRFSQVAASPGIQPVVTDAGIVFVGADRRTLYTASYDLQENSMKPVNRSVLVEHLTRTNPIVAAALQEFPDSVVWCVLADGSFATFTFERNEEVFAWSHGRIPGARVLDAVSLGTVTEEAGGRSFTDMAFVVERDLPGGGSERFLARFREVFADRIGDGDDAAETPVAATLVTLRPESQDRTLAGYKKNVKDVLVRLYETGSLKVRPAGAGDLLELVRAKTPDGLFSGDVKAMPHGYVNEEAQMTFVSDDANPCEVLMLVSTVEVG